MWDRSITGSYPTIDENICFWTRLGELFPLVSCRLIYVASAEITPSYVALPGRLTNPIQLFAKLGPSNQRLPRPLPQKLLGIQEAQPFPGKRGPLKIPINDPRAARSR